MNSTSHTYFTRFSLFIKSYLRRYEVPPGEDALSPDNVLVANTVSGLSYQDEREDTLEIFKHRLNLNPLNQGNVIIT